MIARRKLFQLGLGAVGAGLIGSAAQARTVEDDDIIGALLAAPEPKWLSLHNLHTEEKLEAVYWENGAYVPDAVQALNKVLRDHRTGEERAMDPQLFDLLGAINRKTETKSPFQVISAYRSPASNALLSERSGEVAKKSLHVEGMAMDIYLEDVALDRLRAASLAIGRGGVGYYPVTKFVHVDVGPVRRWQGS
jgi:uncharacterized protein YcbK (DUF882 family)